MRLGRRERDFLKFAKRETSRQIAQVVSRNLSEPRPERSTISRDETRELLYNSHTRGIRIGSQLKGVGKPWVVPAKFRPK